MRITRVWSSGVLAAAALAASPLSARALTPVRDTILVHAEFLDPVAQVLDLPLLRQTPLAAGQKELRIWIEGGESVTGALLRLVQSANNRVTGSLAIFWMFDPSETGAYGGQIGEQLKARYGCRKVVSRDATREGVPLKAGACVATFKSAQKWSEVLNRLAAHSVWTLPDMPHDSLASHSESEASLLVEVREGEGYHYYHYPNARRLTGESAMHAVKILDIVQEIQKAADRGGAIPAK